MHWFPICRMLQSPKTSGEHVRSFPAERCAEKTAMLDAACLKAHRTEATGTGESQRGRTPYCTLQGRPECETADRPPGLLAPAGQSSGCIGEGPLLNSLPNASWLPGGVAAAPVGSGMR
jgi:hypothetical protein